MSDDKKNEEIYDTLTEEESREEELHKARKARAEKMHEEKQRSMQIRRYGAIGAAVAISVIVLIAVVVKQKNKVDPRAIEPQTETVTQTQMPESEEPTEANDASFCTSAPALDAVIIVLTRSISICREPTIC